MAIITRAEYKTWRSISVTTYDALIDILIASAQSAAERWCGRLFDNTTRTQFYSGSGGASLQVNAFPITDIESVVIFNQATQTALQTLVADTDYFYQANTGIIYRTNATMGRWGAGTNASWPYGDWGGARFGVCPNFPVGNLNIQVNYDGGYSTYPDDLKMAMYLYVDLLWSFTWANANVPVLSIANIVKEKIDRHEYEVADLDSINIQTAVKRGMFLTQAKMQELFGTFRRGDLQ